MFIWPWKGHLTLNRWRRSFFSKTRRIFTHRKHLLLPRVVSGYSFHVLLSKGQDDRPPLYIYKNKNTKKRKKEDLIFYYLRQLSCHSRLSWGFCYPLGLSNTLHSARDVRFLSPYKSVQDLMSEILVPLERNRLKIIFGKVAFIFKCSVSLLERKEKLWGEETKIFSAVFGKCESRKEWKETRYEKTGIKIRNLFDHQVAAQE